MAGDLAAGVDPRGGRLRGDRPWLATGVSPPPFCFHPGSLEPDPAEQQAGGEGALRGITVYLASSGPSILTTSLPASGHA